MYGLKEITSDELAAIFKNKTTAEIEVPATITKFKEDVPDVDFSQSMEVALSPVVISAQTLGQALVSGGNDLDGKYLRLVMFVYARGGNIHYTELSSGSYRARISWPAT